MGGTTGRAGVKARVPARLLAGGCGGCGSSSGRTCSAPMQRLPAQELQADKRSEDGGGTAHAHTHTHTHTWSQEGQTQAGGLSR